MRQQAQQRCGPLPFACACKTEALLLPPAGSTIVPLYNVFDLGIVALPYRAAPAEKRTAQIRLRPKRET